MPPSPLSTSPAVRFPAAFALLLALLVPWLSLADHPLYAPDEGRYARTTQEILHRGDWLIPYFEGKPRLQKPPLIHWLQGVSMTLLGETEFAARLPSALFTSLTILLTFWFGSKLHDRSLGLIAAILLANLPLVVIVGRLCIIDPVLNFFWNAAIFTGYFGLRNVDCGIPDPKSEIRNPKWFVWFWLAVSLAAFTKGPVGLLPAVILAVWALIRRRWLMKPHQWALGLLIAVAPILLWALTVWLLHPEALKLWQKELIDRATGSGDHPKPWWFYLPIFVGGFFPATAMLPLVGIHFPRSRIAAAFKENSLGAYLAVAILVPMAIFSAMAGKLPTYILPLAPAVALIAAVGLRRWIELPQPHAEFKKSNDSTLRGIRGLPDGIGSIAVGATIGVIALLVFIATPRLLALAEFNSEFTPLLWTLALPLIALPLLLWVGYFQWRTGKRAAALVLIALSFSGLWLWCLHRGEDALTRPTDHRHLLAKIAELTAGQPIHLSTWDMRSEFTLLFYTDGEIDRVEQMLKSGRTVPSGKRWVILSTDQDWKRFVAGNPELAGRMEKILEWRRPRDVIWVMAEKK